MKYLYIHRRVEGIHLRAARVARGGIRWSDRREDFRTEILGLMKAQQVKNAVIVPLGAKGGFVVKASLHDIESRDEVIRIGIECYKVFIRGLLDITDNRQGDQIIHPDNLVCYDEPDPYLVVAADKGTATFSDIANQISKEYNFWLGDAFASGGSKGYDHKKMGITARGAWESVKMHFQRRNINVQRESIQVIGVGDMAGDVFGNGMLLSKKIKLVAAFNHLHIFIDPNPDIDASYKERLRLFELPRSSWEDYNKDLISKGGGVFSRLSKSIKLSSEVKNLLNTRKSHMVPNELIKAILKSKVDLFWNGGIGTFVKSTLENNIDVGDRANDAIRINAEELNALVVGEGGNLGLTQLARVEYALGGGVINTDAIDNSAGVNCSDNEVNIKVLLDYIVSCGDMTVKQRNSLLASMSEEVAELVLKNNRNQNDAISMAEDRAANNIEMHNRLLKYLERKAGLDREVEHLPNKEEINNRKTKQQGFTRPEIAVLMGYTKILLKNELIESQIPEEPFIEDKFEYYFPKPIRSKYKKYMSGHRLKRELIATQISNCVIDEMGINFIHRLQDETGASSANVVSAYMASKEIFDASAIREQIVSLTNVIDSSVQIKMYQELNRLIRRGSRWFLRNRRGGLDIIETIEHFKPQVSAVYAALKDILKDEAYQYLEKEINHLLTENVSEELSYKVGSMSVMFSFLDIIEAAGVHNLPVLQVASVYYAIGAKLKLSWFRELIKAQPIDSHWEALARASFRDDVDKQQRNLAIGILQTNEEKCTDTECYVEEWLGQHQFLLDRWEFFVSELQSSKPVFTMFAVALRELLDLSHAISYSKN